MIPSILKNLRQKQKFSKLNFCFLSFDRYYAKADNEIYTGSALVEVFCPSCHVGYSIPTSKVPSKPRMLMCRSCNYAWRQPFQAKSIKNTVKRPSYSNTVLKILREEAAIEAKLRD